MLSVLEWTQAYDYFRNYPSDFLFVKITVIAVLFSNTVTTLAACAFCYIYSVIHFGDTASLHLLFWPAPVYLFSSGIAIGGVQIFLLNRYWSLTKNKCVSYAILLLIILAFGSMIYVAVASNEAQDKDAQHAITSILSMRVTGDAAMAIAFNLYLMYTKVEFKSSKKFVRVRFFQSRD
ncbi:hypothetical protein VKT23_006048 [Stygiomarasmius scandens]|uniref:Uncharacterized protein n=1 Tax=Marasmiellus scandens TaxID=2682957 RepID=A0ABR1JRZ9_9AGAR